MPYLLEKQIWSSIFAVPTALVDNHIKLCKADFVKVLLVLLRHGGDLEVPELARLSGVEEHITGDAVLYWQQAGFLSDAGGAGSQPAPAMAAVIPGLPAPTAAPATAPAPLPEALSPALQYTAVPENSTSREEERKIKTLSNSRTRLTSREINQMAKEDENIAFLLQESQVVLGRTLSPVATDTIAALYSYYGMQPDLILMLLQYCVTMGKDSMRYVEKVAASWLEKGVDSHEKAEAQIMLLTQQATLENQVKRAFGIKDRNLTANEQKYVTGWVGEMDFSIEMISLAFERAIDQKGKLSFPYINGILSNWAAKGIRTPAQAMQDMQPRQKESGGEYRKNGKDASYDLGELENMINYQSILD